MTEEVGADRTDSSGPPKEMPLVLGGGGSPSEDALKGGKPITGGIFSRPRPLRVRGQQLDGEEQNGPRKGPGARGAAAEGAAAPSIGIDPHTLLMLRLPKTETAGVKGKEIPSRHCEPRAPPQRAPLQLWLTYPCISVATVLATVEQE